MKPIRIVVCDDTNDPLASVVAKIEELKPAGSPEVILYSGKSVTEIARSLEARRRAAAGHSGADAAPAWGSHQFDAVDLLILDYNYVDLEDASGLTGQRLAYLARCYSGAKFIVVLNQFGKNRFDLTLRDHPETHADLHIGSDHLGNPALWKDSNWSGFRPWYWPVLPTAVEAFSRRVDDLAGAMDERVVDWLGLQDVAPGLPRSIKQFLRDEQTTFEGFARDSGFGFESTDLPFHASGTAHVAASRVAKWLESMVVTGQDVLIDAPRLLSRYPSLLGAEGLARLKEVPLSPDIVAGFGLEQTAAEPHRFVRDAWLSKPAWFRARVMDDQALSENVEGLPAESGLRFAEDASCFLAVDQTRGFVADLASPFLQRFARREPFEGVEYQPSIRFSL
jgi:hypothetical protein